MLRFLADENFNDDIVRGIRIRLPNIDILRAQAIDLTGASDVALLAWAAEHDRIILTHDRATFPKFAWERVRAGVPMPGVFVISDRLSVGRAIEEIGLIVECTQPGEWRGYVAWLLS